MTRRVVKKLCTKKLSLIFWPLSMIVLYFVGQAEGGQGALQNRQHRQNCQTVMKAAPLKLNPPFP